MIKVAETPLMKQYNKFKAKHPDAILLFRVGDFYETFGEDAVKASQILGIVLTKRANGAASHVDLAGFPHHAIETYLPKLVKAGYRVAICDQLENPKLAKTIVKRGITELVTPGVSINDHILSQKENNFLASVHYDEHSSGIAFLDISTGEFYVAEGNCEYIDKLLLNFKSAEIIIQKNKITAFKEKFGDKSLFTTFEDWVFTEEYTTDILLKHFQTTSLKGFGVEMLGKGLIAAGAALHYLYETQHHKIKHVSKISRIEEEHYVWLDRFTIRNLELLQSPNENAFTLLDILDKTLTPMGGRMLRKWILLPLKNKVMIDERLAIVKFLVENDELSEELVGIIKNIGDLERLASKIATSKINPREMLQLARSLRHVEKVKKWCESLNHSSLTKIGEQLNPCITLSSKIEKEISEEAPTMLNKGRVFNKGVDDELDELLNLSQNSKDILSKIQQEEAAKTGITSLKIGFNNVFGYYLEVTNTHKDRVPADWIRKQTLTNGERYITQELKENINRHLNTYNSII